jgi:hypothetical protein
MSGPQPAKQAVRSSSVPPSRPGEILACIMNASSGTTIVLIESPIDAVDGDDVRARVLEHRAKAAPR